MATVTMSFKTDSKIKKFYETFAKSHGLTPSALLNIQMRQLMSEKSLIIGMPVIHELDHSEITSEMKAAVRKTKKTPPHLLHNL